MACAFVCLCLSVCVGGGRCVSTYGCVLTIASMFVACVHVGVRTCVSAFAFIYTCESGVQGFVWMRLYVCVCVCVCVCVLHASGRACMCACASVYLYRYELSRFTLHN